MNKRRLLFFAEIVEVLHFIIFIITVLAMIFIFFSSIFQGYSAAWLAILYFVEMVYGFSCPLTIGEYNLREKAGEYVIRKKFIPRFFVKYFHINLPEWLGEIWLGMYFVLSIFVIVGIITS